LKGVVESARRSWSTFSPIDEVLPLPGLRILPRGQSLVQIRVPPWSWVSSVSGIVDDDDLAATSCDVAVQSTEHWWSRQSLAQVMHTLGLHVDISNDRIVLYVIVGIHWAFRDTLLDKLLRIANAPVIALLVPYAVQIFFLRCNTVRHNSFFHSSLLTNKLLVRLDYPISKQVGAIRLGFVCVGSL